jgi:hypothetical protein
MVAVEQTVRIPRIVEKQVPVTYVQQVPRVIVRRVPIDPCGNPIATPVTVAPQATPSYSSPSPTYSPSPSPSRSADQQPTLAKPGQTEKPTAPADTTPGTQPSETQPTTPSTPQDRFEGPLDEESPATTAPEPTVDPST